MTHIYTYTITITFPSAEKNIEISPTFMTSPLDYETALHVSPISPHPSICYLRTDGLVDGMFLCFKKLKIFCRIEGEATKINAGCLGDEWIQRGLLMTSERYREKRLSWKPFSSPAWWYRRQKLIAKAIYRHTFKSYRLPWAFTRDTGEKSLKPPKKSCLV